MTNFYAQRPVFLCLLTSLAMANGCQSKTEPAPDPAPVVAATEPFDSKSDIFSRSHGYWEWTRSFSVNLQLTPASVGYTRQLVFKGDSMVYIYHNQKLAISPSFHLHAGPSICSKASTPLIDYDAEPQIRNNRTRNYIIKRTATDTTLSINGEWACSDGGQYERYAWHRRR